MTSKKITKETNIAKEILDKYATAILRQSAIFEKNGVSTPNLKKVEDYTPESYKGDEVLWIPPKDCIRIEFEHDDIKNNERCIRECESAAKALGFNYCITEHKGGKSPYFNMFNIKGIPVNEDNPIAKSLLIDTILPESVKSKLDRSNLGWTYSPIIEHPHWKLKYKGAIHKIIRGEKPLEQKNDYLKELLKQIKKSKTRYKSDIFQVQQNYSWVSDFLINYCTKNKLPVGNRNHIIEKNLAVLIIHDKNRDKLIEEYLAVQERKHNSLKGWLTKVAKGEITQVSAMELKKYIDENNIPYEIPKSKTDKSAEEKTSEPITSEEKEILKDPELLLRIIEEAQNQGIQGEEDTILTLTNKITLRLVKHAPTSSNIVVSDKSGAGKDVVTVTVCYILVPKDELIHRTGMSEKAVIYWKTNKDEGWTWDGKVFYLEDPEEELLKGQPIKVMSSGRNISSVVKDQELVDLDIPGKPVMIVTSYLATIEEEGGRRWDAVRVNLSEKLTAKVIVGKLRKAEGQATVTENTTLKSALQKLKPHDVIIPFASKIGEHLPNTLVMRTQIEKLIDYIKSSAVLHQYQRKKDAEGRLIATWFDYDYARFLFLKLRDAEGQWLNPIEEELVNILREFGGPASFKEVAKIFSHSVQWIYNHRENLTSKGIIRETLEYDESASKPITKIHTDFGYSSINLPNSLVLNGFNSHLENQNKEGFNGFNGFNKIYERINKKRQENGLLPLPSLAFSSKKDASLHDFVENRENLSVGGFNKPSLKPVKTTNQIQKINEIRDYIIKQRENGGVSIVALNDNFEPEDVTALIHSGQVIKLPNGKYDWYDRSSSA